MSGRTRRGPPSAADPMDMAEMQATVDTLAHMVTDLQRTVRSQSEEIEQLQDEVRHLQQWEFDIPHISQAHLGAKGEALDEFLHHFKNEIFQMTTTGNNGTVSLLKPGFRGTQDTDWARDYLARDEVLPFWKELSLALLSPRFMDCAASGNGVLSLGNIAVGKKAIAGLELALTANPFKEVTLQNNHFERDGMELVMELVEQNDQLECFCFDENPIESTNEVNRLCNIFERHPSLKRVSIRRSGCPNPSILLPILTASTKLTSINLAGNRIDTNLSGGFRDIGLSDFLASNPAMTNLNLNGNFWTDDDAIQIANALRTNTALNSVDLGIRGRALGKAGKVAVIKAIFDSDNLASVSASNHTCRVRIDEINTPVSVDDEGTGIELPSINYAYSPTVVRRMKVLSLLSAPYEKTVNIRHLEDVPLQLMPGVLAFVQKYPEVYHNFPDGKSQNHWYYMSALRPDTPQGKKPNEYFPECYEFDPSKPAQTKRLCMVYEILRGWKTQTGEPLYLLAGG